MRAELGLGSLGFRLHFRLGPGHCACVLSTWGQLGVWRTFSGWPQKHTEASPTTLHASNL